MELRFSDWMTNLLGIQSIAHFGAQSNQIQQDIIDADCSALITPPLKGFEMSSVVFVKDNLAVIPDQWNAGGVKTSFLNADDASSTLATCLKQIKEHSFIVFDEAFTGILGRDAKLETIHTFNGIDATRVHEAPVFIPEIRELVFADTSAIGWLYAINVETHEVRRITTSPAVHNVNGGTYHASSLYLTSNGSPTRAIHNCSLPTKSSNTIHCTTIVNNYRLAHLNSPNDMIFTLHGHILFTDPDYGWAQSLPGVGPPELPNTIYHFNTTSRALLALSNTDVLVPNGLALSPDETALYVADSNSTSGKPLASHGSSVRNVYACDFDSSAPSMRNCRLVYVCEAGWPDGLRVTENGYLLVATMGGVDVVDVQRGGLLIGKINVGDDVIFNLEPARGPQFEGVWLLTGLKGIYKVTIQERHTMQRS